MKNKDFSIENVYQRWKKSRNLKLTLFQFFEDYCYNNNNKNRYSYLEFLERGQKKCK